VTLSKRLTAVAISAASAALFVYLVGITEGGYMAGPLSLMLATAAAPIAALATFGWHLLGEACLGSADGYSGSARDMAKAVGWVFVASAVLAVGLGLVQDVWGVLGFITLSVSGVTYLLAYRWL
jgi:hypothetical protein